MRFISEKEELMYYLPSIKKLIRRNDSDFPVSLIKRVDLNNYIKKIIANGKIIISLTGDNIVTGCIFFYANDLQSHIGYITLLCIDRDYRNYGIGKQLLNLAFFKMLDLKMEYCDLFTNIKNNKSIHLYKKKGFIEMERIDNEIHFRKRLEMNILLTSVGRRGYLVQYFKEALNGNGKVFVSNSDKHSPAFKYADECAVSPLIYDNNYIDFLLEYCKEHEIKLLISLFDIDLYVLASNKSKFEEIGVTVVVSDKNFIEVCNDKWLTYNYLKENSILVPKTFLSIEETKKSLDNNELNFPLIVKPRWGMGSLEIFTADNMEELNIFYNKIKRNIEKSYLKYESRQDINNCIIIQQKIIGEEYGADIINDLKGTYRSTVIRKKISMRAGETDTAKIVENNEILELAKKIADFSKHVGNLDIDILSDGNKYYVLEMNARFGGGYPFSHLAGVDLPQALVEWASGREIGNNLLEAKIDVMGQKDIQIIEIN